jgi:replicative DNA helicase
MPATFGLADDYVHPGLEQGVLAAIASSPALFWELDLPADAFTQERRAAFLRVSESIKAEQRPEIDPGWLASADPKGDAPQLVDLMQRRMLADTIERSTASLLDPAKPAAEIAQQIELDAGRIQAAIRETQREQLVWASDLIGDFLHDAAERLRMRQETGSPVLGLPTGIPRLDAILGGLDQGLTLLAGAPGAGKTSLSLQLAQTAAAGGYPVVYVTFENSRKNLIGKAITARAGLNLRDVQRGYADMPKLRQAADEWRALARSIAIVEGSSALTIDSVQASARQALNRHGAAQALVIVDYLQLWAKTSRELAPLKSVRERVEHLGGRLREISMQLESPVLAIASQNRASGDYGSDKSGSASLDSLKESGDLEYAADVVLFLTLDSSRPAQPPARSVRLHVSKNRHGEIGGVDLVFRPDLATMREPEQPTISLGAKARS